MVFPRSGVKVMVPVIAPNPTAQLPGIHYHQMKMIFFFFLGHIWFIATICEVFKASCAVVALHSNPGFPWWTPIQIVTKLILYIFQDLIRSGYPRLLHIVKELLHKTYMKEEKSWQYDRNKFYILITTEYFMSEITHFKIACVQQAAYQEGC